MTAWHRAMIWPWGRPSHRTPLPAAPLVLVRKESFPARAVRAARGGGAGHRGVSAPPRGGKTVLLRSSISVAGLAPRVAWLPLGRDERDPQRFRLSVLGALSQTAPGSAVVRPLTAAPELDGWAITERLLKDLTRLGDRVWLVVDDVHELGPAEAGRHLELLVMRGPLELRLVLATRQDVRLGLHQLRLEASCSAQEHSPRRTRNNPARGLACHNCWHGEGAGSRTGLPCRQPAGRGGHRRPSDVLDHLRWPRTRDGRAPVAVPGGKATCHPGWHRRYR